MDNYFYKIPEIILTPKVNERKLLEDNIDSLFQKYKKIYVIIQNDNRRTKFLVKDYAENKDVVRFFCILMDIIREPSKYVFQEKMQNVIFAKSTYLNYSIYKKTGEKNYYLTNGIVNYKLSGVYLDDRSGCIISWAYHTSFQKEKNNLLSEVDSYLIEENNLKLSLNLIKNSEENNIDTDTFDYNTIKIHTYSDFQNTIHNTKSTLSHDENKVMYKLLYQDYCISNNLDKQENIRINIIHHNFSGDMKHITNYTLKVCTLIAIGTHHIADPTWITTEPSYLQDFKMLKQSSLLFLSNKESEKNDGLNTVAELKYMHNLYRIRTNIPYDDFALLFSKKNPYL